MIVLMALLTFFMMDDLIGDWSEIDGSFGKLYVFFTEDMFPPDWSVLEAEKGLQCDSEVGFFCSQAWKGISETIQMAFVATVIGFVISLPIAGFAANNFVSITSCYVGKSSSCSITKFTKYNLGIDFHYSNWFWTTIWCFSDVSVHSRLSWQVTIRGY